MKWKCCLLDNKSTLFSLTRSSLSDLNLSTPLMSGQGEGEGPLEGAGPGWGLALPELYFTLILPVYCSVILLASLGGSSVWSIK